MHVRALLCLLLVAACRINFDEHTPSCDSFQLTPGTLQTNVNTHTQFAVTGGNPPLNFSVTGAGTIDAASGLYMSAGAQGSDTITVTDAAGCSAAATVVIGGDTLWYLGGRINVVVRPEVWSSLDGRAWNMVGSLPTARSRGGVLVFDDRIWYIGGGDDALFLDEVLASSDGITWTLVGHLPLRMLDVGAAIYRNQIWIAGGHGNPGKVWKSSDGVAWTSPGSLPFGAHGGELVVVGGEMLYIGGHDDSLYYDTVYASTDGATWTLRGHLPLRLELQGVTQVGSQLWVAGGTGPAGATNAVYTTVDGSSFTQAGTLPAARGLGTMDLLNGRVWFIGGDDGGAVWSAATPDAWTVEAATLSLPRDYSAVITFSPH